MKARKIRARLLSKRDYPQSTAVLGGWFDGRQSYLWIATQKDGPCIGTLSGQKLYRLAKAIVRAWEGK